MASSRRDGQRQPRHLGQPDLSLTSSFTSIGSSDRRPCVGRSADAARTSAYATRLDILCLVHHVAYALVRAASRLSRRPLGRFTVHCIKTFFTAFVSASFPVHGLYSPVR